LPDAIDSLTEFTPDLAQAFDYIHLSTGRVIGTPAPG
jgi:hypothetical protein